MTNSHTLLVASSMLLFAGCGEPKPDPPEGWVVRYRTVGSISSTVVPTADGAAVGIVPTTEREMYFVSPQEYGYLPYADPNKVGDNKR